jgi:hypothetical protein
MRYGTSYFLSRRAAIYYFSDYESAPVGAAVDRKIAEGLIHIGKPELKPGQTLHVIDSGLRYAIEESR